MRHLLLAVLSLWLAPQGWAALAPFVLPWNDSSAGAPDLSALNTPIGPGGRVTVDDAGHFLADGQRVRFFGMNFAGDSPFMPTNKAEAVAARLAKFGINCVRFHHMDASWATGGGLLAYTSTRSRDFNAAQLDRVHFLIARLKAHGIYANLNLLVGREYRSGDGLGSEVTSLDWKTQHILGFFYPAALALHKEYATRLLTPTNRYTGLPLALDPTVAFVEIINENGLIQKWFDNSLDTLPTRYASQLQTRWNDWLYHRYTNDTTLAEAWQIVDQPLGANMLRNGNFATGTNYWNGEQHGAARATFTRTFDYTNGLPSARIQVTQVGAESWHVQFNQANLGLTQERVYTVTFSAKASEPGPLDFAVMMAHDPWQTVGLSEIVQLGTNWQTFTRPFAATATDAQVRVNFGGIGARLTTLWLADVRLQSGGRLGTLPEGASLTNRNVPSILHVGAGFTGTARARKDWLRLLRDLEVEYYGAMVAHLRTAVRYPGLIFGTITANSPASVQAALEVVDAHSYWQHPVFPGVAWDMSNWYVPNVSLLNTLGGDNTLCGLALQRVKGKPFTVTEYQHPSPNQYAAEGPWLLAAYAALQDWDGLWLFDYGAGNDSVPMGQFRGFFDTAQHPTKMASALMAAALFRRGDVRPSLREYTLALKPDAEIDHLATRASSWSVFSGGQLGMPGKLALASRINTSVGSNATGLATPPASPSGSAVTSDTTELSWNLAASGRGVVTINTPRSKAVLGWVTNRLYNLGGTRLMVLGSQLGWASLGLTMVQGDSVASGGRALVVAVGACENTGLTWRDTHHNFVTSWGSAPSLIEVVPFRLTLPVAPDRVQAWALDPRGQRAAQLPILDDGGAAQVSSPTNAATLWYELEITPPPPTTFQEWRERNFDPAQLADPLISGPAATPANDGVANFVKYALGLDAFPAATPEVLPRWSIEPGATGRELRLVYTRRKGLTDVVVLPGIAEALETWQPIDPTPLGDQGTTERFAIRRVISTQAPSQGYLRLSVRPGGM